MGIIITILTLGLAAIVISLAIVFFNYTVIIVAGLPILLNNIATMIEGNNFGAVHILFGIISGAVTVIAFMGLLSIMIRIKDAMRE